MIQRKTMTISSRVAANVIGLVLLVGTWQLVVRFGLVSKVLLPSPLDVSETLLSLMSTRSFWLSMLTTTVTWLASVVLGALLGGMIGLGLGLNRFLWAMCEPYVEFVRALPSVVLVPLVAVFAGVGETARFLCSLIVVAALMMSTAAASIHTTRTSYLRLAQAWRFNRWQAFRHFFVPATLSHMAVALRAALPLALIVVVAADMLIATDQGLGRLLMDSVAVFDMKTFYSVVIIVGCLGYGAVHLGGLIERRFLHWRGVE